MAPVKERWSTEYKPTLDDVELHLPEEWDNDLPSEAPVYHKRRSAALWTALASLAVVLAVLAAYGYSVLSNQNAQLAWLPGLAKSISAVRAHTSGLEAAIDEWGRKQDDLAARVRNLDVGWQSRLDKVRMQAASLVGNAYRKEREELNARTAALDAQIAAMATRQQAEHTRVVQLEQRLATTRQQLASLRDNYTRGLASVQEQQISNRRAISSLTNALSTDQIDFEAEKKQDAEIVPGISLYLTGTDIAHQRFGGWVWLSATRRRIWVKRQAIQAPIVFYPADGTEAYELVVTRVKQNEVTGYLLVPASTKDQQADVASNNRLAIQPVRGTF